MFENHNMNVVYI